MSNAGQFKPGKSGNPKGRPPSTNALAVHIRRNVEPAELVQIAIGIAKDVDAARKDRISALKFLADYGWSKPKVEVDMTTGKPIDLSKLTDTQLEALAAAVLAAPSDEDGDGDVEAQ
jgi:hypothetical protein